MSTTKGNRKIHMMHASYVAVGTITLVYMAIMATLGLEPSATVLMFSMGALGGGHATANIANGLEHKHGPS